MYCYSDPGMAQLAQKTGYGLDMVLRFNSWQRQKYFFSSVQTGSGAYPLSLPVGNGCSSPWVEQQRCETYRSAASSKDIEDSADMLHFPIHLHGVVHTLIWLWKALPVSYFLLLLSWGAVCLSIPYDCHTNSDCFLNSINWLGFVVGTQCS